MYTGHVAIALAVRGARRDLPLWVLVVAAQACDWVEFIVSPITPPSRPDFYSHAVPFVLLPAAVAAAAVWRWKRSAAAAAVVLAVYLSHPFFDYVTGFKPMWLGGDDVGLALIGKPAADFVVQAAVCVVGFAFYWRSVPPARRYRISAAAPLLLLLGLQGLSDARLEWVRRRRLRMHNAPARVGVPVTGDGQGVASSPPKACVHKLAPDASGAGGSFPLPRTQCRSTECLPTFARTATAPFHS